MARFVRFVVGSAENGEWPKPVRFAAALAMLQFGLFVAAYLVFWIVNRPIERDFASQYAAASVGVRFGWSHIYDHQYLQRAEAAFGAPFSLYLHPPPVAWLAAPLTFLSFPIAALIWQAILLVALGASVYLIAPASTWGRTLTVLSVAAFQPTLFALGYATMSPLILLLVAGALRAMRNRHPVVAGALLGLTALKPQLTLLMLPLLLCSGYWKTALTAVGVAVVMAAVSVVAIGADGLRDYISVLTGPDLLNHVFPWTVKGLVGAGTPSFIATALVVLGLMAVGIWLRPYADLAIGLGVLASMFVAQHLNFGDFVLWLIPIWLAFERGRPQWFGIVAGVTWLTGWFVVGIPLIALAGEGALAIALVAAISAARPSRSTEVTAPVSIQPTPKTS